MSRDQGTRREPSKGQATGLPAAAGLASYGPPDRQPGPCPPRLHVSVTVVSGCRLANSSVDRTRLGRLSRHVLRSQGHAQASVSVAVVDDATIRRLHRRFLDRDYPTDVLSFPLSEPGQPLAGEVVVSLETAARQAARRGCGTEDEVLLYLAHGLLHLCGYDDRTPGQRRRMWRRQKELLKSFSNR